LTTNRPRDVPDPQLLNAVNLVRKLPLRWRADDSGAGAIAAKERGWFEGEGECARALAAEAKMDICYGGGFGGAWPLLVGGERVLAPAMPVTIRAQRESGIDGEYRREGDSIWREAVGVEELFLTASDRQPPPGQPFEILWFGESERFILRSGHLEVSDLFGELRVPAHRTLLENLLVRGWRICPDVIATLGCADHEGPQTVEVRRPAILSSDAPSLDGAAFMSARADVERVRESADRIIVRSVGGAESSFGLQQQTSGWKLTLQSGRYVFTSIHLERGETALKVRATLADDLDGMAPGMRGRLVFDLRADLVALG
jgi:hypothetical protein